MEPTMLQRWKRAPRLTRPRAGEPGCSTPSNDRWMPFERSSSLYRRRASRCVGRRASREPTRPPRQEQPSWIAQVGPQEPPAPFASLRAKVAPLRGRVPPMEYVDNLERCRPGRLSETSMAENWPSRVKLRLRLDEFPVIVV